MNPLRKETPFFHKNRTALIETGLRMVIEKILVRNFSARNIADLDKYSYFLNPSQKYRKTVFYRGD